MSGIVTQTTQNINYETGEVVERESIIVRKSNKEEYVRFFIDSIDKITGAKLTAAEHNVLYMLQRYTTNNSNMLFYNKKIRELIAKDLEISPDTVRKCVDKLVKKGLVEKPERGTYYLNPIHFGRGDWKEIKKLRKEIIYEYDFENLEANRQDRAIATYEDEDTIKSDLIEAEVEETDTQKVDTKTTEITHTIKAIEKQKNISAIDKLKSLSALEPLNDAALKAETPNEIRAAGEVNAN